MMNKVIPLASKRKKNNKEICVVSYHDYTGLYKKHQRLLREHDNLFLAYELLLQDFEHLYDQFKHTINEEVKDDSWTTASIY